VSAVEQLYGCARKDKLADDEAIALTSQASDSPVANDEFSDKLGFTRHDKCSHRRCVFPRIFGR
jgi:hypothetical protein